jgi:uncharacterized membrane protein
MRSAGTSPPQRARLFLIFCIVVAVASGIFFRFANLGGKFYYDDEVASALHESGHTAAQFAGFFDGRVRSASYIVSYFQKHTGSPFDTIRALADDDPQHPPLFYLANQYWTHLVGQSIADQRSLAALFGAAAIAATFWFGLGLYRSVPMAGVLTAIVAVSPFHVIYSQQNREYSAWFFFLVLCSALLLRALDNPSAWRWIVYGSFLALALYTSALLLLSVVSFGIYVGLTERRWSASAVRFVLATGIALAAYVPWLAVMIRGSSLVLHWPGPAIHAVSARIYILKGLFNTGTVFFDMEYERTYLVPVLLVILMLILASLIVLARGPMRVKTFVFAIVIVPLVAFVIPDLLHNTSHGIYARYFVPVWFGYELAVAYLIGLLVLSRSSVAQRFLGATLFLMIIASGIASDIKNEAAPETWAAAHMSRLGVFGRAINADTNPLVVYVHDGSHWDISVAGLTTVVRPDVRMQLFGGLRDVRVANSRFFLFNANQQTKDQLDRTMRGRWIKIDSGTVDVGSAIVHQLQAEAATERAGQHVSDGGESPLWEHLPS